MSPNGTSLELLATLDGYRASFQSVDLWHPHVLRICHRHGWTAERIRAVKRGTFPVFTVDEQRLVKFFGPLFEGETCWQAETEALRLMDFLPQVPTPVLLVSGEVTDQPGWWFHVYEYVDGVSLDEAGGEVPSGSRIELARWLGEWTRQMHDLPMGKVSSLRRINNEMRLGWYENRRQEIASRWPAPLQPQVDAYLDAHAKLMPGEGTGFIHADLTQEHILGRLEAGSWTTLSVIDWGDAVLGDIYYELTALHLDLFECDKRLLKAYLQAYGFEPDPHFKEKAMLTCLLHQFDVIGHLFKWRPELQKIDSLDALGDHLWNLAA